MGLLWLIKLYRFQVDNSKHIICALYCVFTTPSLVSFHHDLSLLCKGCITDRSVTLESCQNELSKMQIWPCYSFVWAAGMSNLWPRMAMNVAQHNIINLLKTLRDFFLFLLVFIYLMCGPRQLFFFQFGPEMPKGWTLLEGFREFSKRE